MFPKTLSTVLSLSTLLVPTLAQSHGSGDPGTTPSHAHSLKPMTSPQHVSGSANTSEVDERGLGLFTFTGIRATWYGAGLGACGDTYSTSDFIVALAQNTFGWSYPSKYCNRPIEISYGGKTAKAKIVDSCVACALYNPHALDLSEGLFKYFAPMDAGVINVSWRFTDGDSDDDSPPSSSNPPKEEAKPKANAKPAPSNVQPQAGHKTSSHSGTPTSAATGKKHRRPNCPAKTHTFFTMHTSTASPTASGSAQAQVTASVSSNAHGGTSAGTGAGSKAGANVEQGNFANVHRAVKNMHDIMGRLSGAH